MQAAHHVGGCSKGASRVLLPRKVQCGAAGAELSTVQSRLTGIHTYRWGTPAIFFAISSISCLRSERPALPLRGFADGANTQHPKLNTLSCRPILLCCSTSSSGIDRARADCDYYVLNAHSVSFVTCVRRFLSVNHCCSAPLVSSDGIRTS